MQQWLDWQQQLHPRSIDLGLERIGTVYRRLNLPPSKARIISIAGTNGKGSCAHAAQQLAHAAGLRSGTYTSPHLWRYNERIRIDGVAASDAAIVAAFEAIEAQRQDVSLSYFEFGTLAALYLFAHADLDVWVLEVGLGGRLDAVNLVDADVSVVTSIGLDHQAWLGDDLNRIASEKAAIARAGKPLLLGPGVPQAAAETGRKLGAQVQCWDDQADLPDWQMPAGLVGSNLQLAVWALRLLGLAPGDERIQHTLSRLSVPGRCQWRRTVDGAEEILDVAHNLEAVSTLARFISDLPERKPVYAVFSVLDDKPVERMVEALMDQVDVWCIAPLADARAMSLDHLAQALSGAADVRKFTSIDLALEHARSQARRLVVCGSFLTVAAAGTAKHG